jgi:hypothetical protein
MSILSPIVPTHGKPISSALIKKTYSLLIGPPAHLIALMLRIAARIVSRLPGRDREKIPGSWDTSDAEEDEDEWDDDEDDFGIPLGNNTTAQNTRRVFELPDDLGRSPEAEGDSWEID